jgi:hypothetical protein
MQQFTKNLSQKLELIMHYHYVMIVSFYDQPTIQVIHEGKTTVHW